MSELPPAGPSSASPVRKPRLPLIEPRVILTSLQATVCDWQADTDALAWGANAEAVLRLGQADLPATGAELGALTMSGTLPNRFEPAAGEGQRDEGRGAPYRICFDIAAGRPATRRRIEETGRWFAGPDGRPLRSHGLMRVIDGAQAEDDAAAPITQKTATPVMSRPLMLDSLTAAIARAERRSTALAFFVAGVANLAELNERQGFAAADEAILGVARRIRSRMRAGDRIGRLAGNRLGLLIDPCDGASMAIVAKRFVAAVAAEAIPTSAGRVQARIAVGGVSAPLDTNSTDEALQFAEEAFIRARDGSHRGGFADHALAPIRGPAHRDIQPAGTRDSDRILIALNAREIELAYEPIVDAGTGAVLMQEAFATIRGCGGRLVGASDFIPGDDRSGLRRLVDQRTLELVFGDLAARPRAHLLVKPHRASLSDADWLAALAVRLDRQDVAARLTIAIEDAAGGDFVRQAALALKGAGLGLMIDGFGAGTTPVAAFQDAGIDMVRIDGAFIEAMARSADGRFHVRMLIDLAHSLGIKVAASWVSGGDTARELAAWGCDGLHGPHCHDTVLRENDRPNIAAVPARRAAL